MNHPNPIIDGFKNLTDFRGRTSRKRFWPFAGVVIGAYFVLSVVVGTALVVPMMTRAFEVMQANPQAASTNPAALMPDTRPMVWISLALELVALGLLSAAVFRRLHDRGLTGLLLVLPLPGRIVSTVLAWNMTTAELISRAQQPGGMALNWAGSALFWIGLAVLVVILILPGQAGANRFGLPPFDADR